MGRHPYREPLIWMTICVWSAVGILSVSRFKFAARSAPMTIQLATKPPTIRLSLDSERYANGGYLDTPIKLQLKAGRHQMKIARDGYVAHIVTIEGLSGDSFHMEDVVLARNPATPMATVQIVSEEVTANFDIDDGLVQAETPFTAFDITADQIHQLTIYPKWPNKDMRQRCRFTPSIDENDPTAPYKLRLRVKNGKFKVYGCDGSRPSHHH